jgi:hypothetical protein
VCARVCVRVCVCVFVCGETVMVVAVVEKHSKMLCPIFGYRDTATRMVATNEYCECNDANEATQ